MTNQLVEVRCPFKRRSKKDNNIYPCNHLCVKVNPGSSGETWCSPCKLTFEFEVNAQSKKKTSVRVKQ